MSPSSSPTLVQQQQALLRALFVRPHAAHSGALDGELPELLEASQPQTDRGLAAYRANGHAMAERSLLAAYPVISAMIGSDSFASLACDLWHHHPPNGGDLARWGNTLPGFLQDNAQLADVPYLGDVARAEWALHRAAGAPDARPDLPSFARLANEDPQGLALTLAPGSVVVTSRYPVASLVTAHLTDTPSLAEAAQRLREGRAENALIWRQGLRPRIELISPSAAALLRASQMGADLPQALDAATLAADPGEDFDFTAWLTRAVTNGLVIGVHGVKDSNLAHPEPVV